jgi:hypothetical protein
MAMASRRRWASTDEQRDKLRGLHEAAATTRKAFQRRADLQLAMLDLRKAMRAPTSSTPRR